MTWVMKAWKSVRPRTISQCFAKCGFIMPGDGPAPPTELDSTLPQEELALQAEKDTVKYPPLMPPEQVMELAKKTLTIKRLGKPKEDKKEEETLNEADKETPTSSCIVKALEDVNIYATLRGDTDFLDGKWDIMTYMDIVKARVIQESTQKRITDFYPPARPAS